MSGFRVKPGMTKNIFLILCELYPTMPAHPAATLPTPSPEAAQHSSRLVEFIQQDIAAQGGWISFARYMELALYAPGLGYYTAGAHKFGAAGDFVTAPELSPLFGRTVARQVAEILAHSSPHILELGAGSGKLATDMLAELEQLGSLPDSYAILEVSADLRAPAGTHARTLAASAESRALAGRAAGKIQRRDRRQRRARRITRASGALAPHGCRSGFIPQ